MGQRIKVDVEEAEVETDNGGTCDGLKLECTECGRCVEVRGTSEKARNYGFVKLREACTEGDFFYVEND